MGWFAQIRVVDILALNMYLECKMFWWSINSDITLFVTLRFSLVSNSYMDHNNMV